MDTPPEETILQSTPIGSLKTGAGYQAPAPCRNGGEPREVARKGKPAFTQAHPCEYRRGLTKRELFAAMAMQGLVIAGKAPSGVSFDDGYNRTIDEANADVAWKAKLLADALIAELEKE